MRRQVIYTLRSPDTGAVRYVGKTDDEKARLRQHIHESKRGVRNHVYSWIGSLLKRGQRPVMHIDVIIAPGQDWKEIERERIAYYRAIGCDLTNFTEGGDGAGDMKPEVRAALSERTSRQFSDPVARAKQSRLMKERCKDKEWLAARTAKAKATRASPEYKQRMSERAASHWRRPGFAERMQQIRAELNADPAFRAKIAKGVSEAQSRPEHRAMRAELTRNNWANPEIRARRVEGMRAKWRKAA